MKIKFSTTKYVMVCLSKNLNTLEKLCQACSLQFYELEIHLLWPEDCQNYACFGSRLYLSNEVCEGQLCAKFIFHSITLNLTLLVQLKSDQYILTVDFKQVWRSNHLFIDVEKSLLQLRLHSAASVLYEYLNLYYKGT